MWLEESGASMHTSGQLKVPPERLSEDNPDHSSFAVHFWKYVRESRRTAFYV
jgi:hypothetical protein